MIPHQLLRRNSHFARLRQTTLGRCIRDPWSMSPNPRYPENSDRAFGVAFGAGMMLEQLRARARARDR